MANCTNLGFAGSNVPLPDLLTTTDNLTCFVSGYTQAANKLTLSIYATGNTSPVATISGSGVAQPMSTASFQIQPNQSYYAVASSSGGQTPQVLTAYDTLSYGTTSYVGSYTLCAEDTPNGGDCDFNDCVVNINWTLYAG